jgi:hypothetical protein
MVSTFIWVVILATKKMFKFADESCPLKKFWFHV